jgi:hypothetical protein
LAFLAAAPVAAPAVVELLLPMASVRNKDCRNGDDGEELQERRARKKTVAAEWDRLFTLPLSFIPPLEIYVRSQPSTTKWKRPSRSSHPRVSSWEPRHPLRTVIKETVPVVSHSRVGRAVKHCQRPGRAAGGPTIRLVLAGSGHSCSGWCDNSKKHVVSNDAILWAS